MHEQKRRALQWRQHQAACFQIGSFNGVELFGLTGPYPNGYALRCFFRREAESNSPGLRVLLTYETKTRRLITLPLRFLIASFGAYGHLSH